ncbi:hypothetical protein CBR_g38231 [Chara braunii]|uniref:DUF4283 domain-containing protein n=1 Tax=Chara braunii TaxID=69332 RepID=A0A388LPJ2_CHABU|nr:hypothetical protein CBR_g38231 [Chara braunii]|eukprot:GBG84260.1 hypothetical protein CBR_g38231 [Chara braunii]
MMATKEGESAGRTPLNGEEKQRIKGMLEDCYAKGILPEDLVPHAVESGPDHVRVVVNKEIFEIQASWLRQHAVSIRFGDDLTTVPVKVKNKLVRIYEDGWAKAGVPNVPPKRGVFKHEGRNLVTYIASSQEIATWMLRKGQEIINLDKKKYSLSFMPWMTENQLFEWNEATSYPFFWIRLLQVPISMLPHLRGVVSKAFGAILRVTPAFSDPVSPDLWTIRFDLTPSARLNYKRMLVVDLGEYGYVEIEVVCADTPWCSLCKRFFHTDSDNDCSRSRKYKNAVVKEKGAGKEKEGSVDKGKDKEVRVDKEEDPNFQEKVGEKEKEVEKPPTQPSPSATERSKIKLKATKARRQKWKKKEKRDKSPKDREEGNSESASSLKNGKVEVQGKEKEGDVPKGAEEGGMEKTKGEEAGQSLVEGGTSVTEGLKSGKEKEMQKLMEKGGADEESSRQRDNQEALDELKKVLDTYCELSEASINWEKSVFLLPKCFNLEVEWGLRQIPDNASERLLGVQISLSNCEATQDSLLQEKVVARTNGWARNHQLSLFGRDLVLSSAAFSVLWFPLTVHLLGEEAYRNIKRAAARYLWKPMASDQQGFIVKAAWELICNTRENGGLGVLDPMQQNVALLAKWPVAAMFATEEKAWIQFAEYILMEEWSLQQNHHVWLCFMIPSYTRRRPNSQLWRNIISAWSKILPRLVEEPRSKEEILNQILFENGFIRDSTSEELAADGSAGSFGRAWVEHGILQLKDLWD